MTSPNLLNLTNQLKTKKMLKPLHAVPLGRSITPFQIYFYLKMQVKNTFENKQRLI